MQECERALTILSILVVTIGCLFLWKIKPPGLYIGERRAENKVKRMTLLTGLDSQEIARRIAMPYHKYECAFRQAGADCNCFVGEIIERAMDVVRDEGSEISFG